MVVTSDICFPQLLAQCCWDCLPTSLEDSIGLYSTDAVPLFYGNSARVSH